MKNAAFDAVWHKGLLAKLRQAGVTGSLHNLLESYLSDRIARTMVEGQCSSDSDIKAGVPQGSRLGPILFILYINDLVYGLKCMPHIFADDTRGHSLHTLQRHPEALSPTPEWALEPPYLSKTETLQSRSLDQRRL